MMVTEDRRTESTQYQTQVLRRSTSRAISKGKEGTDNSYLPLNSMHAVQKLQWYLALIGYQKRKY